jgi:hypothetical protein
MRALLAAPLVICLALPAWADARITVLVDVLRLEEAAQILGAEGLQYGAELDAEMLEGAGGAAWQAQVEAIYDPARMTETVRRALEDEMAGDTLEEAIDFFAGETGSRVVTLENTARAAIADEAVEEAARARYAELVDSGDMRLAQVTALIDSGDMIGRNVTSAMNSNYQFLRGLAEGDATDMSDEEILADVAADLDEITEDTTAWLYGYMLLAYHPLPDEDLEAYIAFSNTPAGQALNRALFAGFGRAYEDISYALGRAAALNMAAEEL